MGIETHRAGSAPRGRQISRRLALQSHGRSALDFARLDHAALSVAVDAEARHQRRCPRASRRCAKSACRIRPVTRTARRRRIWRRRRQRSCSNLKVGMVEAQPDREIIALIAYLQRLGTDIKAAPVAAPHRDQRTNGRSMHMIKNVLKRYRRRRTLRRDFDLPVLCRVHRHADLGLRLEETVSEHHERPAA